MSEGKRLHREEPLRTRPIRNFSGLYQLQETTPELTEQTNASAAAPDPKSPATMAADRSVEPATKGAGSSSDLDREPPNAGEGSAAADQGIPLAYRVIEKHISDGKKHAGQLNNQPYNTRALSDAFQVLLERTIQYSSELFPLWLEALGSAVKFDPSSISSALGSFQFNDLRTSSLRATGNDAPHAPSTAVSIEIDSTKPVHVRVDLRHGSESQPLVCLGLHAVDSTKPPLTDINLIREPTEMATRLRIAIPSDQPPGTYSGVIVNRKTGEPHGTLTVSIAQ